MLIVLVQSHTLGPVAAALCGFLAGGILSYRLNRQHTFGSERPHRQAIWRFALVAGVGFVVTYLVMQTLVGRLEAPYLLAQVFTTGVVMLWTFTANRLWTFRSER